MPPAISQVELKVGVPELEIKPLLHVTSFVIASSPENDVVSLFLTVNSGQLILIGIIY